LLRYILTLAFLQKVPRERQLIGLRRIAAFKKFTFPPNDGSPPFTAIKRLQQQQKKSNESTSPTWEALP
jgi:hypothetical protein